VHGGSLRRLGALRHTPGLASAGLRVEAKEVEELRRLLLGRLLRHGTVFGRRRVRGRHVRRHDGRVMVRLRAVG
jgi:hypothetical protein